MSEKKVKCGICGLEVEGEDCQLMVVVQDEEGRKVKACCTHLHESTSEDKDK